MMTAATSHGGQGSETLNRKPAEVLVRSKTEEDGINPNPQTYEWCICGFTTEASLARADEKAGLK
jgi:hypothetical protein